MDFRRRQSISATIRYRKHSRAREYYTWKRLLRRRNRENQSAHSKLSASTFPLIRRYPTFSHQSRHHHETKSMQDQWSNPPPDPPPSPRPDPPPTSSCPGPPAFVPVHRRLGTGPEQRSSRERELGTSHCYPGRSYGRRRSGRSPRRSNHID